MNNKQILEALYSGEARMTIDIGDENDTRLYTDVSVDFTYNGFTPSNEPDCNINHFGYNFFVRTRAGVLGKKYKTLKRAITEIKKTIQRHGKCVTKITIDNYKYIGYKENESYAIYYTA